MVEIDRDFYLSELVERQARINEINFIINNNKSCIECMEYNYNYHCEHNNFESEYIQKKYKKRMDDTIEYLNEEIEEFEKILEIIERGEI